MNDGPFTVVNPGGQVYKNPTSAAAVSAACPAGAEGVIISVNTQDARISFDGSVATATNGLMIKAGSQPLFFPIAVDLSIIGLNAAASDISILWVK